MKHYHHLTEVERYQIEAHLRMGVNLAAIAAHLDRPRSCISREVSRNGGSTEYRAEHAQVCYREQLRAKGKLRQRWHAAFHEVMVPLLREGWSPEQISGVFRGSACAVSHEWVYQRILQDKQSGGLVYRHLRCQKQRKKRYGSPERRGQIINRRSISERPAEVESRQQLGHWEGDTMIGAGHRGALVTLVERTSGLVKIQRVASKEAKGVTRAIHRMLKPHRDKVHSLTFVGIRAMQKIIILLITKAPRQLIPPRLKGVGDVFEKNQAEHQVLVFGSVNIGAQLVGGGPEGFFDVVDGHGVWVSLRLLGSMAASGSGIGL